MESHIAYDQLLEILSWALYKEPVKGTQIRSKKIAKLVRIPGAMYGGIYIGSPGKDIFMMLPFLSDSQMDNVAKIFVEQFPFVPPVSHLNIAACIRFIYGQFERKGVLRSDADLVKMTEENPDWSLPRKFITMLKIKFIEGNNFYGLTILCEMEGHRLGDEAIINKDTNKFKDMEAMYTDSIKYAHKCKSIKQYFTPYYWAARYFDKAEKKEQALKYYKLTIKNFCPDKRICYKTKLYDCLRYIETNEPVKYEKYLKIYNINKKNKK